MLYKNTKYNFFDDHNCIQFYKGSHKHKPLIHLMEYTKLIYVAMMLYKNLHLSIAKMNKICMPTHSSNLGKFHSHEHFRQVIITFHNVT